ncbi:glutamic-type intramembrane protease PrsW [Paenibacillus eucommiae]|uniref:Protease PrsW n=1 Tax=Paenibacillus eucommiae TaxID=1355755 RepID=A0ABS4IQN0_9BACL|nr:glutamic-type intramembrane protease PrsW [Paenibacillus eucommiae]MBP1988919.1 RsiW-degrading membrane proteinase PrsW (M82 family) [Paenibacillus eucommiae]
MHILPVLVAAIAPGLSLLAYFYLKDRYETEPIHLVMKMFLFGLLIVFPAIVLQHLLKMQFGEGSFFLAFILSGGLEEFLKWFLLYQLIYRHPSFDEPYDGIVYGVAVSMGYATLENVFYAFLSTSSFGALLVRALLPVSGHALFGVMMGYYLGKAKFTSIHSLKYKWLALLLPIFWHGSFDYILLEAKSYWLWFMIPFMVYLWTRTLWKVEKANAHSSLRVIQRDEKFKIS